MNLSDPQLWVFFAFCVCLLLFGLKGLRKLKEMLDGYIYQIEIQFVKAKNLCEEAQNALLVSQNKEKELQEEEKDKEEQTSAEIAQLESTIKEKIALLEIRYEKLFIHEEALLFKNLKEKLLKELVTEVCSQIRNESSKMSLTDQKAFLYRQINQIPSQTKNS